ncbi:putative phosphoribosyl 1,2-cyclic phosphate 1,2-diphosphodiesterase [Dioscorea sansibarensis]
MGDKKKKKKNKSKRSPTADHILASRYVHEWFLGGAPGPPLRHEGDEFLPSLTRYKAAERIVFEFHSHSKHSDGFLSPSALVERAHRNGVKVLALTDHDTMAGVSEAVQVGHKFGIKIIPGVEISAVFSSREGCGTEESVHILAYFGSCGPARYEELERVLSHIRDGRFDRAKNMLLKLRKLKMPIKWENVVKIAGSGVAPGRVHVARAMIEAGYVENLKQAFSRYLYDDGPAYAKGSEPSAEVVVQLICHTGGVAVLAHPWALKDPVSVIKSLKNAGLHAMEVYRSDGKMDVFSDLASIHDLVKIGGSDFHGRGGHDESDLGTVNLSVQTVFQFLKLARPIWCNAAREILLSFAADPSNMNLEHLTRFRKLKIQSGIPTDNNNKDVLSMCLTLWLTSEERETAEIEAIRLKLSDTHCC